MGAIGALGGVFYIDGAQLAGEPKDYLFRTSRGRSGELTEHRWGKPTSIA